MARGRGKREGGAAKKAASGANLGFEAQLFLAADKLRKNLEPSDPERADDAPPVIEE